jgi:hypothetical protein
MNNGRLLLASVVAPLVMPAMIAVGAMSQGMPAGEVQLSLLFYVPFAYLAAASFGVPMFWLFKALGWDRSAAHVVGGALVGALTGLSLLLLWRAEAGRVYVVFCSAAGMLYALAFWLTLHVGRRCGAPHVSADGEI